MDLIFELFFWLDFFLNFFQGFKHEDTYEHITDMKEIAKKYLFGWLCIDAVSIFPFKYVLSLFNADSDNAQGLKLIRLARMPRMGKLIDINRIKNVLKSLGGNNNNDEEIVKQYQILYLYKLIRMIIIAFIITYFLGCIWYFISENFNTAEDVAADHTWILANGLHTKS